MFMFFSHMSEATECVILNRDYFAQLCNTFSVSFNFVLEKMKICEIKAFCKKESNTLSFLYFPFN